jgi:alkyl sulfatase BDS1-like metallo-beta-lactamase superfamily hydrolase
MLEISEGDIQRKVGCMSRRKNPVRIVALVLMVLFLVAAGISCGGGGEEVDTSALEEEAVSTIENQCENNIGEPRVEQISEHVWAAIGYDLANTLLIHTDEGNVIVDVSTCPSAAREVKQALAEQAPAGPVKAIIYTHSHIDHVGGAIVWAEEGVPIWATDGFIEHFFKQYMFFLEAERVRGKRQFGANVSEEELPCSSIGNNRYINDLEAMSEIGFLVPTNTFSGSHTLELGGIHIEMHEALGETHDQLNIWIPEDKTLCPADDFYWTFPNLYTIRGSSPRPIDAWIASIDAMRRFDAEHLIPMHTKPIHGNEEIAEALTTYRDGIQWIRDEVVRRANKGEDIDTIAESIELPEHLSDSPYLTELYGQVDWSARAYYTNELGWFDGSPSKLYPPNHNETASREIGLMGGANKVLDLADEALDSGDLEWAVHLLSKLEVSGLVEGDLEDTLQEKLAESYNRLGLTISNTNGRGYLLESSLELSEDLPEAPELTYNEETIADFPLELIFANMVVRLNPLFLEDDYKSVQFVFPDVNKRYIVTIRYGIAELAEGEPFPGTPEPLAILTSDSLTYKKLTLGQISVEEAAATGNLSLEGDMLGFQDFIENFE